MQVSQDNSSGMWDLFGKSSFMGFNKRSRKTETLSYPRMMRNRIAKRRAKNKVARKSRRINQLRAA